MLKFRASAFRNGITEDQIREVLADHWGMTRWFKINYDKHGNSQDMAVGFDAEGISIEIGLTYIADDDVVFHADKVTTTWKTRFARN